LDDILNESDGSSNDDAASQGSDQSAEEEKKADAQASPIAAPV